uniref:Uncharacterized protein n=1 Tax=Chlamydomonas euryale TaxID=1486919 RepID=A0A7R9UZH9_9CHLO
MYADAKEAYLRAAKLEPDNQAIQQALQKAEIGELQHVRDSRHVFKKARIATTESASELRAGAAAAAAAATKAQGGGSIGAAGAVSKRSLLSFGGEEEDEEQ